MPNTLILFSNDLRVHDNAALQQASRGSDTLLCVYILPKWFEDPGRFGYQGAAKARSDFLENSLQNLAQSLENLSQQLWVIRQPTTQALATVITAASISRVVSSETAGWYESTFLAHLKNQFKMCAFDSVHTHTLFSPSQLPFSISELPPTFTKFRKQVESLQPTPPNSAPEILAPPPALNDRAKSLLAELQEVKCLANREPTATLPLDVTGGEQAGLIHANQYFSSGLPSSYKEVRNSLDGFENSTKLSPWLANGCLSAREVFSLLKSYESNQGANDSTYWIFFELLWREFFQWNAHKLGKRLFYLGGAKKQVVLTSYYPERFQKWANGNTPYPLVNAIMRELVATGYISNRGRQIAASCFVNELSLDWRYGAAFYERHLIDYDVASNWGNWQYLAGVGADVQPKRHFNLAKQATQFDPQGSYTDKWGGTANSLPLDSVDAADWPIN